MKRSAEKQMTKDDADDDEIEEISSSEAQGFKKADAATLASRPMKGIPKRSLGAAPMSMSKPSTPEPFKGFGTGSAGSPFTFTPPTSSAPTPGSPFATGSPLFSAPKPSPASPTPTSVFGVSSNASNSTKSFASLLNNVSQPSAQPLSAVAKDKDDPEAKYYLSLRGLNTSFSAAISKALAEDPFMDISEMLKNYEALRTDIQARYDERTKASGLKANNKPSSSFGAPKTQEITMKPVASMPKPPAEAFSFGAVASKPQEKETSTPATMPKPPASGFTFGGFGSSSGFGGSSSTPSTTPSGPIGGGFKPNLDAAVSSKPSSGFSFSSPPSAASASSLSTPAFNPFGAPKTDSNKADEPRVSFSPFGASTSTSTSTTSFFSNTSSTTSKTPSAFAGGVFGASKTKPGSDESALSTSTSAAASASKGSPFGFGFGSTSPSASTPGLGSIGNPVGFSFGSPSATPEPESHPSTNPLTSSSTTLKAASSSTSAFSFSSTTSAPPQSQEPEIESGTPRPSTPMTEGTNESRGLTPSVTEGEDGTKVLGMNPNDVEGEGEEDEETMHSVRLKVFKLKQSAEGKPEWGDMGIGYLRLKRHKETNARRALLRNTGNGKIIINFKIFAGLNPTRNKNTVMFVGHDEGQKATYRLKVKDEASAAELKQALDREIAALKKD